MKKNNDNRNANYEKLAKLGIRISVLQTILGTVEAVSMPAAIAEKLGLKHKK